MKFEIYGGRNEFWQWDLNQKLVVNVPDCSEVHFCNKTDDCALVCEVQDGIVAVPNILLQEPRAITVFAFTKGSDEAYTKHAEMFRVLERTKPSDYVYTETEVLTYENLDQRVKKLESGVVDTDLDMTRHGIENVSKIILSQKRDIEGEEIYSAFTISCGSASNGDAFVNFSDSESEKPVRITGVADGTHDSEAATCGQLWDMAGEKEDIKNRVDVVDENSDHEHYPTAKAVWDTISQHSGSSSSGTADHSIYFAIDVDGVVSVKSEYRADGAKNSELPEVLVIPDVINNIAVSALAEKMFDLNTRVKSVTIPNTVRVIPFQFAKQAPNLYEVKGTENIETICKGGFIHSGIRKALFPNLKAFDGTGQFNGCANLAIVDIGDTVTDIPASCFSTCERLSLVRGGASVATIGTNAFYQAKSLKNLPMIQDAGKETSPITSIGNTAFMNARVAHDWWALKDNPGNITFGTNATPAHYNASEWWEGRAYTACENPLNSTFHQGNPEWVDVYLPRIEGDSYVNSHGKWGDGCLEISAVHIISALTGIKFNSPVEFIELLKGKTDEQGDLLAPVGVREDSSGNLVPAYTLPDMLRWFKAMGLDCKQVSYNSTDIKEIDSALADGGMVLSFYYVGSSTVNHAVTIYGIAENGEVLLLDSAGSGMNLGDYTPRTFQMPFYSFATKDSWAVVVNKKEE